MQFSVLMELHEKCMISIFPYMKIVWLAFLVNPGKYEVSELTLAALALLAGMLAPSKLSKLKKKP